MTADDLEHLKWIYERLAGIYHEKPDMEYMIRRFATILNKLDCEVRANEAKGGIAWPR